MAPHSSTLAWKNPMDRGAWKAAVHGVAEGRTGLRDFTFTIHFYALEKEMAAHSSVLAWRIPGRDGGAWWAAVYGVAQSRTRLKRQQQQQQQQAVYQISILKLRILYTFHYNRRSEENTYFILVVFLVWGEYTFLTCFQVILMPLNLEDHHWSKSSIWRLLGSDSYYV